MDSDQNAGGLGTDVDAFYDDKQVELNLKVMELARNDADFRAHMLDDPEEALAKAGLLEEAKALAAADAAEGDDVEAHRFICKLSYYRTCRWWQHRIYWHRR